VRETVAGGWGHCVRRELRRAAGSSAQSSLNFEFVRFTVRFVLDILKGLLPSSPSISMFGATHET